MKRRKIGEKFKTPDGVELEVCGQYNLCMGCYYYVAESVCDSDEVSELLGDCDGLIFKEVE